MQTPTARGTILGRISEIERLKKKFLDDHNTCFAIQEEKKKEAEAQMAALIQNRADNLKVLEDELTNLREQEKTLRSEDDTQSLAPMEQDVGPAQSMTDAMAEMRLQIQSLQAELERKDIDLQNKDRRWLDFQESQRVAAQNAGSQNVDALSADQQLTSLSNEARTKSSERHQSRSRTPDPRNPKIQQVGS